MKNSTLIFFFLGTLLLTSCYKDKTPAPVEPKQLDFSLKGIGVDPVSSAVEADKFDPIVAVNANAISVYPLGIVYPDLHVVNHNLAGMNWGERSAGIEKQIDWAHENGMKVMIYPRLFFADGRESRSYDAGSEANWEKFEKSYKEFVVHYAVMAKEKGAELLSLGSDMEFFVENRPDYWEFLIDTCRMEFDGKLTYSAHRLNYDDIPFWNELDYIGIRADYSVSLSQTPSVEDVISFWETEVHSDLISISASEIRPVIFTEIGYKSIDFAGEQPWNEELDHELNETAQANLIQGFLEAFSEKVWFEGAFINGWSLEDVSGNAPDKGYSVAGKESEVLIEQMYSDTL